MMNREMTEAARKLFGNEDPDLRNHHSGTAEELTALSNAYFEEHDIQPGQLVMWKPGLKAMKVPEYGKPMVVLEVEDGRREEPSFQGRKQNPCDTRIGFLDPEGDLIAAWVDMGRLMPYEEQPAEAAQ